MRQIVVAFAVLCAACTAAPAVTTTTAPPALTTAPATTIAATTTTVVARAGDPLLEQVRELMSVTEELRGLYFLEDPTVILITPDELAARLRDDIAKEFEPDDLARAQEVLRILGVLEGDLDLGTFYTDLLAEVVVGYYDSEAREMVVAVEPDGLTEYDKLSIVHELTHALTDQHFDFGPYSLDLMDDEKYDADAAFSGLIEGDGLYVEGLYIQSLSQEALLEILASFEAIESPVFGLAPYFLQESLVAHYTEGLGFVTGQYGTGGWSAVDLAYRIPPATTEQLLHPEAYLRGEPARVVEFAGTVPESYTVGEESTWGELGLRSLLGAVLLPVPLRESVEGWGGDVYRVWWDGMQAIFQMHYVGDTSADSDEFAAGFAAYLEATVPADARWWILRDGDEVVVVVSSDPGDGTSLVKSLKAGGYR